MIDDKVVDLDITDIEPGTVASLVWQVEAEEAPAEASTPLEIDGKVIAVTDDPWGVAATL